MSFERLQLNLLSYFEKRLMPDVIIVAQGKEIPAHQAILAAQSTWFCNQFAASGMEGHGGHRTIELEHKYKVVYALVRFMYFGGVHFDGLAPHDCLDLLLLSEELGINAMDQADLMGSVVPQLTPQNCLDVLNHEGLSRYPTIQDSVIQFIGENFLTMLKTSKDKLQREVQKHQLASLLRVACHHVGSNSDTEDVVRFCLAVSQLESACDLLRETKTWNWGGEAPSILRALPLEGSQEPLPADSAEWRIEGIQGAMDGTPARLVLGTYFDWCIRLDYGSEGRLRLVYESATPKESGPRCINRFPAAMFAWRVIYRGQDVFNEKPVFICFPENVSLHWSTTLPVSASDLSEDDDLVIMVSMAENPMISLVLYYFSSDLKTTVFQEDILNRLPHIEYRCLSSYSLVKTHGGQ